MMTRILSIDPGMSSGIALGTYSATEPYRRIASFQPRGGARGFADWWKAEQPEYDEIVCERFSVRQALAHDAIEPVRVEGWLIGEGIMPPYPAPNWQEPSEQYWSSGSLQQKKAVAQSFLKKHSLWATGKQFHHVDGADVNSATLHALAALRRSRHVPTIKAYWPIHAL